MNIDILKRVILNKKQFVPLIFTDKQFLVMQKYFQKKSLTNSERKALYTAITKKIRALESLKSVTTDKEFFVQGNDKILPERFKEAKKIIEELSKENKKIFVSGSFLFSKEYDDIDIFVIREKGYKEVLQGKKHLIFLTEKRLSQPIFQSTIRISISNFLPPKNIDKKKIFLDQLMSTYHEAIIELLRQEEKPESLRRLVFYYELLCNNRLLDPLELNIALKKSEVRDVEFMFKKLSKKLFTKSYLYVKIHEYIKTLKNSIKIINPNVHLTMFKKTYEEIIYGRIKST
ncbi:hypothetical protein HY483_03215 [Candidatus Woesearchaeota archaeon]|nr:hypothetical protein [Candidatus Woesearchaeota archaeon]